MLTAIDAAQISVRLETYIFSNCPLGREVREALIAARKRDVRVQVLVDAWGSQQLADEFWAPFIAVGGEFRWFNPFSLERLGFRDHRKLLVCDAHVAITGGFNIAPEYQGDGIASGWRDLALLVTGDLARELAVSFDFMFDQAAFKHFRFMRLRKTAAKHKAHTVDGQVLASGPGRGQNPIARAMHEDLAEAKQVHIAAAYFLPTWRIWRDLLKAAKRGAAVQLMLPANSDVPVSQLATQSLYRRLMRAGVQIHEYLPQMLHSKFLVIDNCVYIGSANLDIRSFYINYELMIRIHHPALAEEARQLFASDVQQCRRIDPREWRRLRTFWTKLKEKWSFFLLARIDPYIARRQLKTLR
ncbi:MAG: phospholipase D-like domain-containing protein [Verrucomicrobiota bacterium]